MEKELVSVIIPNFNSAKTIKLCLDAIYRQDYEHFEVLVVDDCSTDASPQIIREYPCVFLQTPHNSKVSVARNLGARQAKGSILFFVDSDVVLFPDAITNLVREFRRDPAIGCVCGMYAKTPLIRDSVFEEYRTLQNHYWLISSEGYVTPANFALGAVKKSVFEEVGEFNPRLTQCEDVEYGHRLNKKYKLWLTSKVMGQHDHDDKLTVIIRKLSERARQRVPLYCKRRKFMKGFETGNRAFGILFAFMSVVTLVLGLAFPVSGWIALGLWAAFLLADFQQYVFVYREKGLGFTLFFTAVHYLVSFCIALGLVRGVIDMSLKRQFRENYELV